MRFEYLQDRLQISPQFLRQFLGLETLSRHAATARPIPFHPFKRMPFLIEHPFDLEHRLDVPFHIKTLIPAAFLGLEKRELRFPESQDIGGELRHQAHLTDFVEDFAAEPWFVPHGPVLVAGVVTAERSMTTK